MAPKPYDGNQPYKAQLKSNLYKLNHQIQNVKVDFTRIKINTLASQIVVLSGDVKLYMKILTTIKYCALNDRAIELLMKDDIGMGVVVDEAAEPVGTSGAEMLNPPRRNRC